MAKPIGARTQETPDFYVLAQYEINSGIAGPTEQTPRDPSVRLRFAEVVRMTMDSGLMAGPTIGEFGEERDPVPSGEMVPAVHSLGQPAYRLVKGGAMWEYDVPSSHLRDALIAAATEIVTATLSAQGSPEQRIMALLQDGQPESCIRRAAEALEARRQGGEVSFDVRTIAGTPPTVAQAVS